MPSDSTAKTDFFRKLAGGDQIAALFDQLGDTYVFGKDRAGRFVFANRVLVEALGYLKEADILGRTDFDLFDPDLAERYRQEDSLVMTTAAPLVDQVWLVPNRDGTLHWYLSTKRPLFDRDGSVIGIAGVMRDFDRAGHAVGPYRKLSPVLAHVQEHYPEKLTVADLANLAEVSVSTLERSFAKVFGISPTGYLTRVRLHAARRALLETDRPIGDIAVECGFYDQSHFTKSFREAMGRTPSRFRKEGAGREGEQKSISRHDRSSP